MGEIRTYTSLTQLPYVKRRKLIPSLVNRCKRPWSGNAMNVRWALDEASIGASPNPI